MEIGNSEITLREAIFSVTIASVLTFVGFIISEKIEHYVNKSNLEYRQAVKISNSTNEFERAISTDVGNAFVEGKFRAVKPVSHDKIKGKWLLIDADYRKYTMHTRVVTYTTYDSKGRAHTRTRIENYWSWDNYKYEHLKPKEVEYIGVRFPFDKFDYSRVGGVCKTVENGFRKRIDFYMKPMEFDASAYTVLGSNTVSNGTVLYKNLPLEKLYDSHLKSSDVFMFWTFWVLLTVLCVVGFVILDNKWIED